LISLTSSMDTTTDADETSCGMPAQGHAAPGFEHVRAAFERNFASRCVSVIRRVDPRLPRGDRRTRGSRLPASGLVGGSGIVRREVGSVSSSRDVPPSAQEADPLRPRVCAPLAHEAIGFA
jgi:hypothetical protein